MELLKERIEELIRKLPTGEQDLLKDELLNNNSKYPFNRYTNIFSVLFNKSILSFQEYTSIRTEYYNRNPYLDLFEMAPRTFGQTWGEKWLKEQNDHFKDPPEHSTFDLWIPPQHGKNEIRIEVKSSHVARKDPNFTLIEKAYKKPKNEDPIQVTNEIERLSFEMNFQQLKPSCCDVFVWLAVWLDNIDIWVIPASKILMRDKNTPRRKPNDSIVNEDGTIYMGIQHQGGKGGKVQEGQIFITNKHYKDLNCYKATLGTLIDKIMELD